MPRGGAWALVPPWSKATGERLGETEYFVLSASAPTQYKVDLPTDLRGRMTSSGFNVSSNLDLPAAISTKITDATGSTYSQQSVLTMAQAALSEWERARRPCAYERAAIKRANIDAVAARKKARTREAFCPRCTCEECQKKKRLKGA